MSYLFVAYLWKKDEYAPLTLADVWGDAEPRFAGEQLVHVSVNSRVEAAFYFPGNFSTKSEAFAYGCEAMLADGWAEAPGEERREAGDLEARYLVWLSSDMFEYDVVLCFDGISFNARAIIDGQGERVLVEEDVVKDYAFESVRVNAEGLDESAYFKAAEAREKPFSPGGLVHQILGVSRQQVIQALHKAWDQKGKVLWPKDGPQDTPELRKELESGDSFMPGLPLWSDWGDLFVPPKKSAPTNSVKKKNSAKKSE